MGQPITCGRNRKKPMLTTPKLQEADIQGFYKELKTNPAFKGRFETVPLSRILLMANEILVFLSHVIRNGGSPRPWVELFDLHSVMFITETEIEALFRLFFQEFHVQCDEYLCETDWLIKNIKNIMFSKRVHSHKLMKFYVEIKRNPILRNTFRTTSPSSLSKMMGELFWILATAEKENELRAVENYHRNIVISEVEYDEFVNLYFQIYCPDVNYRVIVGPKLFSIKEIMVGQKLRRVEAFGKAIVKHKIGQKFKIPEDILGKMCAQMVDMVQHPDSHDFEEMVKSHMHLDIEVSDFDDIIELFLSISKSDFVEKAKPVFNKLKKIMFNRLSTE